MGNDIQQKASAVLLPAANKPEVIAALQLYGKITLSLTKDGIQAQVEFEESKTQTEIPKAPDKPGGH